MENRAYALLTGAFVLLLGAAAVVVAIWLAERDVDRVPFVVVSDHPVSGLMEQSVVRYRGVDVGRVEAIRFDPERPREVRVAIRIKSEVPVTHGTYARLRLQGVTGLAQVDLDDDGDDPRPLPTREEEPATLPMRPSQLEHVAEQGQELLNDMRRLTESLHRFVDAQDPEQINRVLAELEQAARAVSALPDRIQAPLATVPRMGDTFDDTMAGVDRLVADMNRLVRRLDERVVLIDDVADRAARAGETGEGVARELSESTLPRVHALTDALTRAIIRIERLADSMAEDPQQLFFGPPPRRPGPGEPGHRPGTRD